MNSPTGRVSVSEPAIQNFPGTLACAIEMHEAKHGPIQDKRNMNAEQLVEELKQLCHDNELQCVHKGMGHYHVYGYGDILVNYYPLSKKRTAYVAGTSHGLAGCSPQHVIKLALGEKL